MGRFSASPQPGGALSIQGTHSASQGHSASAGLSTSGVVVRGSQHPGESLSIPRALSIRGSPHLGWGWGALSIPGTLSGVLRASSPRPARHLAAPSRKAPRAGPASPRDALGAPPSKSPPHPDRGAEGKRRPLSAAGAGGIRALALPGGGERTPGETLPLRADQGVCGTGWGERGWSRGLPGERGKPGGFRRRLGRWLCVQRGERGAAALVRGEDEAWTLPPK